MSRSKNRSWGNQTTMEIASSRHQFLLCWPPGSCRARAYLCPTAGCPGRALRPQHGVNGPRAPSQRVPTPGTNAGHSSSLLPKLPLQPSPPGTRAHEQSQPLQRDLYLKDDNCTIESMSLCRELCIGAALQCQHRDWSSYSSYPNPPRPTDPQASAVPADLQWYLRGMMGFEIIKHLQILGLVDLLKILMLSTQHGVWLTGKRPVFSKHCESFALYIGSMVPTLTN